MSLSHGFLLFCFWVAFFQLHFTFATSNSSGLTLRAFLDDSPESPLYRIENLTRAERLERLIKITNARAKYLNLVSNANASAAFPDNIPVPILREGLFYVVRFAIGSQGHMVKLLLDTGSGLTWTQCLPCEKCFQQYLPVFDPRYSATYAGLPCDHPICQGEYFTCLNGVCQYEILYGGGSFTRGIASMDIVHFFIDESLIQSYHFIFGCTKYSLKMYFEKSEISGIFGLDLSPESLTQQLSSVVGNRFSYCLAPFGAAIPPPLVLRFGQDIPQLPPQHVQSTQFVQSMYNKYYNLELLDISVAGHRIGFPPDTFQVRGAGSGGCFIDSGSVFTHIDGTTIGEVNAFEQVLRVFDAYYESRGLRRRPSEPGGFELCYDLPNNYNDFASITFHFNGADYYVQGIFTHGVSFNPNFFCVAIVRSSFATVLGAYQQQNKRIIYDGMLGELQFADENCMNDIS